MGQATIDLPDPTQLPPDGAAPAAANSADDLLSQLAGDEIDRLLAEADVDVPPAIVRRRRTSHRNAKRRSTGRSKGRRPSARR